jgi:hypothetical protein
MYSSALRAATQQSSLGVRPLHYTIWLMHAGGLEGCKPSKKYILAPHTTGARTENEHGASHALYEVL